MSKPKEQCQTCGRAFLAYRYGDKEQTEDCRVCHGIKITARKRQRAAERYAAEGPPRARRKPMPATARNPVGRTADPVTRELRPAYLGKIASWTDDWYRIQQKAFQAHMRSVGRSHPGDVWPSAGPQTGAVARSSVDAGCRKGETAAALRT